MQTMFVIAYTKDNYIEIESIPSTDKFHALIQWCKRKGYTMPCVFNYSSLIDTLRAKYKVQVGVEQLRNLI